MGTGVVGSDGGVFQGVVDMKSDRGHFWDLFFPMDYCSYLITLKKKQVSDWRQNVSNIKVIIIKTW